MISEAQKQALKKIGAAAVTTERMVGVPAELLTAQCILESGWLKHAPGNNCFGIKYYSGATGRHLLRTKEWFSFKQLDKFMAMNDGREAELITPIEERGGRRLYAVKDWFATFPSLAACFTKRALLFDAGRYKTHADAWRADRDIERLVRGIGPIYATDPGYADAVLRVIRMPEVVTALAAARAPLAL